MLSILIIWLVGFGLVVAMERLLKTQISGWWLAVTSWWLGLVMIGLELLLLSWFGIRWSKDWLIAINLILPVILLGISFKRLRFLFGEIFTSQNWTRQVIVAILIFGLHSGTLALYQGTNNFMSGDGLAAWVMKGKIFFVEKTVSRQVLSDQRFVLKPRDDEQLQYGAFFRAKYPILTSLAVAWSFIVEDQINIQAAKWLWIMVDLFLLMGLYTAGRNLFGSNRWESVIGMILYASLPVSWTHFSMHRFGTADIWLAGYFLSGISLWYFGSLEKNHLSRLLGMILLGSAVFTKTEGMVVFFVLPLLLISRQWYQEWRWRLLSAIGFLIPGVLWYWFAMGINEPNSHIGQVFKNLGQWQAIYERLVQMMIIMAKELVNINFYGPVWLVWISLLIGSGIRQLKLKKFDWNWWLIQLLIFVGLGLVCLTVSASDGRLQSIVYSILNRQVSQWVPLVIWSLMVGYKYLFFESKDDEKAKKYVFRK